MNFSIREISKEESHILSDFLYEAIYVPKGLKAPLRSIIELPELQVYIKGFGEQKSDIGLVAEADGKIVGAIWTRIMNDYGHIDECTPSLAISLYKEYRNHGIGTAMMLEMFKILKQRGYKKISLSVQKENYAVSMYIKLGYSVVYENEEEYIMVHYL
jgi:ribosomal protein S18 acetylase RimI-like enzyme